MKYFSPTTFAAILVFLALPFGSIVSCEGDVEAKWTGYELVTQSVDNGHASPEDVQEVNDKGLFALPILAAALFGVVSGMFFGRRYSGWAALVGLASTIALVAAIDVGQPEIGVLLTFLAFVVLCFAHYVSMLHRWGQDSRGPPETSGT